MSPAETARATGEATEMTVQRTDRVKIPVRRRDGHITVGWDCQVRSFTIEDLRRFIEHMDLAAQSEKPFSLAWADSNGRAFWVRVKDDKLHADGSFVPDAQCTGVRTVSWTELKRILQAQIATSLQGAQKERADT